MYDNLNTRDCDSILKFQRIDTSTLKTKREIERGSGTIFEEDMNEFGFGPTCMHQDENAIETTNHEDSDLLSDQYGEVVDTLNPDDDIYAEIEE